jgi:DNA topoisomerase IB
VLEFAAALPRVRERAAADLELDELTREQVLAAAVRLLDLGFFRVGRPPCCGCSSRKIRKLGN